MSGDGGFRIHRDEPNDMSDEQGVEEVVVSQFDWPAAATVIAFFVLVGFVFWLFLK